MSDRPRAAKETPLAIICGGGSLPLAVADAVTRRGRRVVMFPVRGFADPRDFADYPCHLIATGQFGRFRRLAVQEGCRDVVFIGVVLRPALRQIRLDWDTIRQLPRIFAMFRGGDNHLLSSLARIVEDLGFKLHGAHEVAPDILVPQGAIGRHAPGPRHEADIARGLAVLAAIGPFDVGQAVVVADSYVVAIEGAEGTDRMLERVTALRRDGRIPSAAGTGVLVKTPKRGQDRRFDLPSIGPQTVARAAEAGLAGIAVAGGATIIAEPQRVAAAADRVGLFVVGIAAAG